VSASSASSAARSLLEEPAASCNGFCDHFFSFSGASGPAADVGAASFEDASAAWSVAFADAATGAPATERALQLSGDGETAPTYPVIIPSESVAGALTVSVTASHDGDAAWRTLFDLDGLTLSIHAAPVNVAAPGAEPLWVRDFMSIANANGDSSSCSMGVFLTSDKYIDSNDEIDFEQVPKAAIWSMSYYCMPRQVRDALEPLAGGITVA
jgi:hypothetical protein